MGDPAKQLREAVRGIEEHEAISVAAQSPIITTKASGKTDQPDFANMAIAVETSLKPLELLEAVLAIELDMGRVRQERWGPRLIDIDLIAYEQMRMETPRLTLPHPHAHERDFVLQPLRTIAPEVADWLADC